MMENLKEAIEYLVNLGEKKEKVINVNGNNYSTKHLHRINDFVPINTININTLNGLIDYIKSNVDIGYKGKLLVIVRNPELVTLETEIDSDGKRDVLVRTEALLPTIEFDRFYTTEKFNILLQSAFISESVDVYKEALLKVVGNIREEVIKNVGDDGVSQVATIKTGVATVQDVKVPNPVRLKPYRTFPEVDQPESEFIFRMKDGPECALFEADGGAWRLQAMKNIKEYLEAQLSKIEGLTIIS